jgi:hypothetical protein
VWFVELGDHGDEGIATRKQARTQIALSQKVWSLAMSFVHSDLSHSTGKDGALSYTRLVLLAAREMIPVLGDFTLWREADRNTSSTQQLSTQSHSCA